MTAAAGLAALGMGEDFFDTMSEDDDDGFLTGGVDIAGLVRT